MTTNYTKTPTDTLVISKELFKSGDVKSIKSTAVKEMIKYYATKERITPLGHGKGWNDIFERLSDIETSSNEEKGLVPFDILDYYDLIHHMNGTRAHEWGDLQYQSNVDIGCLGQIRKLLRLMDPHAEPTRVSVVQKVLPRGRNQFAPTYSLNRADDIEDESVKLMAHAAVKLHNAYFAKDHEMRLLFDWGTQCQPPILEWSTFMPLPFYAKHSVQHIKGSSSRWTIDDYFSSTKWKNLKDRAANPSWENDLFLVSRKEVHNKVVNLNHFQTRYDSIIRDLRQIIGWAASLYQLLTSHYGKKLYVTERLIQGEGFMVNKRANGDLEISVSDPSAALLTCWSYFANADGNIPELDLKNVTRLSMFPDDEHKHIHKTVESGSTAVETLSDVIGLSVENRTKFLRDEFGMTKNQVYLLSMYMIDAYNEAINKTGDGVVLIKTGDTYRPHDTSDPEGEIAQQADLDKLYEVVSKLDARNITLGTESPENQWMLGFSEFYGEWITMVSRTTDDKLAKNAGRPATTIPGMVEYTADDGEVWCSFNYNRGKDWWFPKKELPCGSRGRIWFDEKLDTYVFIWFYRKSDGSIDWEKMEPYRPDQLKFPDRWKPVAQLIDLHKFPYSDSGLVWGRNIPR